MTSTASNTTQNKLTQAASPAAKKAAAPVKTKTTTQSATTRAARPSTVKKSAPKTSATPVKAATAPASKPAPVQASKADALKTKTSMVKAKTVKEKKVKVMRDSFTIPKTEFNQIAELKKRAVMMGVEVKKSELIRAGLLLINGLTDASFKKALSAVPTIKTGRPSKD